MWLQRLADVVAGYFVPAAVGIAVLAFIAWATACHCALGLATSMSIQGGVGRGAQAGVLIKNAEAP